MSHTYEFSQSPNRSLRPALSQIYEQQLCSDILIEVTTAGNGYSCGDQHSTNNHVQEGRTFRANKSILAVRSPPLALLINQKLNERKRTREKENDLETLIGANLNAEGEESKT